MKTAVVLSGGGCKGAFQIGVIHQLVTQECLSPDAYYGTSIGAINSTLFTYVGVEGAMQYWLDTKNKSDVLTLNWWKLPFSSGMYSTKKLKQKLASIVGQNEYSHPATVCWVDLRNGKVGYTCNENSSKSDYVDAVIASATIPFAMEPVHGYLVDGGVREQTPLKKAIDDGADKIIIVMCNPMNFLADDLWQPKWPYAITAGLRAVDLLEHEVMLDDLLVCFDRNGDPKYRQVELVLYAPDRQYIDTLEVDPVKIRKTIDAGLVAKPIQITDLLV